MNAHIAEWSFDAEMTVQLQLTQEELAAAGFMTSAELFARVERVIEEAFQSRHGVKTPPEVIERLKRRIVL